jgi:hypothetical protein
MQLAQQEMTMFKHATDYTAAVVLTDAQLELISGGFNENIPTCPELPTIIHSGGGRPGPSCGPSFGPVSPGGSWTGI